MSLIKPVITEKSMRAAMSGLYTFVVEPSATKSQIKTAVQTTFKVQVKSVTVLNRHVPAKTSGPKRLKGVPTSLKHATLRLAKGQSIALFDLKESEGSQGGGK